MSLGRKLRRQTRRERRSFDHLVGETEALFRAAAASLGFDEQRQATAERDATSEDADMLHARVLELLELGYGGLSAGTERTRAEIQGRRGAAFFVRVAAMGRPAAAVLTALRAVLLVLLVLVWPALAHADLRVAALLSEAHKIQRRNLAPWRKRAYHFRPWTRRRRSFATSRRRSSCRSGFEIGCERGRGKNDSKGLTSRLSWSGGVDGSASATCPEAIRISRSSWPTARSSSRRICEAE